jgi:cytochrome c oxidase subunit 4
MAERVLAPATYWSVLAILLVLTVLTVSVSFIPMAGVWHIACGLVIGSLKGSLVLLFFMHAWHSERVTWVVIAAALTWLVILFSLTLCDYFTRGLVPYMPGH